MSDQVTSAFKYYRVNLSKARIDSGKFRKLANNFPKNLVEKRISKIIF